jgi:hypothetical protein
MSEFSRSPAGGKAGNTESVVQRFDAWLRGDLDLPEWEPLRRELLGLDQERAA